MAFLNFFITLIKDFAKTRLRTFFTTFIARFTKPRSTLSKTLNQIPRRRVLTLSLINSDRDKEGRFHLIFSHLVLLILCQDWTVSFSTQSIHNLQKPRIARFDKKISRRYHLLLSSFSLGNTCILVDFFLCSQYQNITFISTDIYCLVGRPIWYQQSRIRERKMTSIE